MSDNEALITQFMDVTGVTRERAEFYLESSNYQLQVNGFVIVNFFDYSSSLFYFARLHFRASTRKAQLISRWKQLTTVPRRLKWPHRLQ
jgi:UBA-like domain